MGERWQFQLLGGFSAQQADRVITRFQTHKTGALLAYLAYYLARPHPREELIALLWPESALDQGRQSLSVALSSLRHQLEPPGVSAASVLLANRATVQLNPEACATDVATFEAAIQSAAQARSRLEKTQHLLEAVALYRGELLPGYYQEWCDTERLRLSERHLNTLRQLVRSLMRAKEFQRALDYASQEAQADPLREEAHYDLMRLSLLLGRPSVALRQYRELEQRLREQMGVAPAAPLRRLARDIAERLGQASADASPKERAAPAPAPAARPQALPLSPGTVTFLLTDIPDSLALRQEAEAAFLHALATHHSLLRAQFGCQSGQELRDRGEGFVVAFPRATDALACAVTAQRALAQTTWPQEIGALHVRMALHTGEVETIHRQLFLDTASPHSPLRLAERILLAAHGGQILCSAETAALLNRHLEDEWQLNDLGFFRLREEQTPEKLFEIVYPGRLPAAFPAPNAVPGLRSHLPFQLTRFFGRAAELAELQAKLLSSHARLITLTGPGGTGKTRLAIETAEQARAAFGEAIWFVPLADLSDTQRIPEAVASALRLPRSADMEPLEQIVAALSGQRALLLLDNFEHLLNTSHQASAPDSDGSAVVRQLLERLPDLTCLVTSRQRLGLAGEQEFAVAPLPTPEGAHSPEDLIRFESARLFVDRA